ncbi:carboxy-terminal domain RNA polymerase II polypeptide A small phosphatase 1-like [Impatiens glandulifera]|uniref:carboxy-terminal domain RNA polymerase II polypeptide A small phosphatase 1-like n=1 Tax=Impatiens glandulifera TaxID=253017 RepID=UPI001FB0FB5E|nr:carboxy-terminal domain RNA polymerase II polypeptide A small phosphatase 1-like [Impatiens glandulifera]
MAQTEVYAPKSLQLWRALLNWFSFFFQIFAQVIRGTPSVSQVFSYVGLGHRTMLSSSFPSFKPLPVVELSEVHELGTETPVAANDERVSLSVNDDLPVDRLTVVLDLDETLVCAYETSSLPSILRTQAIDAGLKWFDLECVSSDKESDGKSKINHVTVFERPGLREFLRQLNEFADLVLFTAGLEGYAKPLVDRIDAENRFIKRLYRPSTINTEYREYVKDLSCVSKDLRRMVIVDNNPFSFILQPVNGIPCLTFSVGQPQDDQLLEVILPLLRHLSEQGDVRPVLYDRFHMPEWFQKNGIPPLAAG